MKFEKKSKYDKIAVGIATGLITALTVTLIVIYANSKDYTVSDHFKYLFDKSEIGKILRSRVLLALKGGALGIMLPFYLALNKNMYNIVKGLIGVAALIFIIIVAGAIFK
ncbi:MAG: hypothetical protein GXO50_03895 [Chlorobi bacterium]|nr:hypothetical protein [Chlorobiota bacterium]